MKTPHNEYKNLDCIYLDPKEQEKKYPALSMILGWNTIRRRNIGFVEAYNIGADIIATVDDDNIPYDLWGKELYVNKELELDLYEPKNGVFDPLSITKSNFIWHRGYPIEYVPERLNVEFKNKVKRKVLVQADLWDGDPDIDAIARLIFKPHVNFDEINKPYCSNKIGPFDSQNTFLSREVIPYYMVFPFIGRMDDIWGAYILQKFFPDSVIYNRASVYQERNEQELITNLEEELFGYRYTSKLINDLDNFKKYLPEKSAKSFEIYQSYFEI